MLQRIIIYGWLNFWRNFWVSSATMGVMVLALLRVASLILFNAFTKDFTSSLEQKVDVSVYFVTEAEEKDILSAKSALEKWPEVKNVRYISRNEALDTFKESHADNNVILESLRELDTNPLQATLNIKTFQASQFSAITSFLENSRFTKIIDKINYRENEKVINKLISITATMKKAGIIFSAMLSAFVVLVTFNTIRLAIYSSREEISIMRLVGGGNWYIRGPFIVTGALYGVIAAIITFLLFFIAIWFLAPRVSVIFADIDLLTYYQSNLLLFGVALIGGGVGLGIISSFVATRRYLKV